MCRYARVRGSRVMLLRARRSQTLAVRPDVTLTFSPGGSHLTSDSSRPDAPAHSADSDESRARTAEAAVPRDRPRQAGPGIRPASQWRLRGSWIAHGREPCFRAPWSLAPAAFAWPQMSGSSSATCSLRRRLRCPSAPRAVASLAAYPGGESAQSSWIQ